MLRRYKSGIYQIKEFIKFKNVIHGFSAKELGNMSFKFGGEKEVNKNREKFLKSLSLGQFKTPNIKQVHSNKIKIVDGLNIGDFEEVDALATSQSGICLLITAADCYPILFYDLVQNVIGIAHVGWRGAKERLPSKMIKMYVSEFGSDPKNLIAGIGPGICSRCYKFADPLQKDLPEWKGYIKKTTKGLYEVDILSFVAHDLTSSGVNGKNILKSSICTKENNNFYSNVEDKEKGSAETGRFAAVIGLKNS